MEHRQYQFILGRLCWLFVLVAFLFAFQAPFKWVCQRLSWQAFWSPFYAFYWAFGFVDRWPFGRSFASITDGLGVHARDGELLVFMGCLIVGFVCMALCWLVVASILVAAINGVLGGRIKKWFDKEITYGH